MNKSIKPYQAKIPFKIESQLQVCGSVYPFTGNGHIHYQNYASNKQEFEDQVRSILMWSSHQVKEVIFNNVQSIYADNSSISFCVEQVGITSASIKEGAVGFVTELDVRY